MPKYTEIGEFDLRQAGWHNTRFDVYRCRIEYPVVPSSVVLTLRSQ